MSTKYRQNMAIDLIRKYQ